MRTPRPQLPPPGIGSAVVALAAMLAMGAVLRAQEAEKGAPKGGSNAEGAAGYHRRVQIPVGGVPPAIVVSEFFAHGQLRPDARNLAVSDGKHRPVPWRILQAGPGDFCRVAFQAAPGQRSYRIDYGGRAEPVQAPEWTSSLGLVLETRRWRSCDLDSFESLRTAFEEAEPIGSDYVPAVYHRFNPIAPAPDPFLSLYRGTMRVAAAGKYRFFTSSQDASFLRIDGQPVAAAPGDHGPDGDARHKGEATLTAGPHTFEYYHGAAGPDACMVAAWLSPRTGKPEILPPEAFGSEFVAHLPAVGPYRGDNRPLHDFIVKAVGEVPVADSDQPLVRVQFRALGTSSRARWDFGDGQTSTQGDPMHIYLHPGLYTVKFSVPGEAAGLAIANRVEIGHAVVISDRDHPPDQLAAYLPVLDGYDAAALDPPGLLQLVRAYDQAGRVSEAARVGRAWLLAEPPRDEATAHTLAGIVGPMLRDRLADPAGALAVWQAAAKAVRREAWKAECAVEAADIALNDLLRNDEARPILDAATALVERAGAPALAARLHRVWGDWHARKGDRASALTAYRRAMNAQASPRSAVEQDAWRGALSRSAEAFLRDNELDRALAELRRWQDEYPADKVEGYLPLLQARYRAARREFPNAIALADDLVTVNPDSPYADRLIYLAAECEERLGHTDRALAEYKALVTGYPGSPLVPGANQKMARLATGQAAGPEYEPEKK